MLKLIIYQIYCAYRRDTGLSITDAIQQKTKIIQTSIARRSMEKTRYMNVLQLRIISVSITMIAFINSNQFLLNCIRYTP